MSKIVLLGESVYGQSSFNIEEKEITDMGLVNLCMESVQAGADLTAATAVTINTIDTQIKEKAAVAGGVVQYAESATGQNEIVEIYAEAVFGSGGIISKLVDKIVAVFRMLVNLVSGFFQKFTSNAKKYRGTLATIQAIGRDIEKTTFPDSAKFDVVPHAYGDALKIAPTLLDTDKYMKLKLGTGSTKSDYDEIFGDMKNIAKMFEDNKASTSTAGESGEQQVTGGTAKIDGLSAKINNITGALGTDGGQKAYDKFLAYLINSIEGLKDAGFKTPINLDKSVREKLISDIFKSPNEKKKVTPKEAYAMIGALGKEDATATIDKMLRTLQDGAKKFKEIGDDFAEVGRRLKSTADRAKDNDKTDKTLKEKSPALTSALTSFSAIVALLNGSLNSGYTIGAGLIDQTFREAGKVAGSIESAIKKHGAKA